MIILQISILDEEIKYLIEDYSMWIIEGLNISKDTL